MTRFTLILLLVALVAARGRGRHGEGERGPPHDRRTDGQVRVEAAGNACQCSPLKVRVSGGRGPYVVDADRLAGQNPIGLVNLPREFHTDDCSIDWTVPVAAGTAFRIRAIDKDGRQGFSGDVQVCNSSNNCGPIVQGSPGNGNAPCSCGGRSPAPSPAPQPPPQPPADPAPCQHNCNQPNPHPVVPVPAPNPCAGCTGDACRKCQGGTTTFEDIGTSSLAYNPNDPYGPTVPDCSVEYCDSALDTVFLSWKGMKRLWEEELLQTGLTIALVSLAFF